MGLMNAILTEQFNLVDYLQNFSHLALSYHQLVLGNHHAFLNKISNSLQTLITQNNKSQLWLSEQFSQIAQDLQQHHTLLLYLKEHDEIIENQFGPCVQQSKKISYTIKYKHYKTCFHHI